MPPGWHDDSHFGPQPDECACGEPDCMYLALGYPYCVGLGCGEHHRTPIALSPSEPCPVDVNAVLFEADEATADAAS